MLCNILITASYFIVGFVVSGIWFSSKEHKNKKKTLTKEIKTEKNTFVIEVYEV